MLHKWERGFTLAPICEICYALAELEFRVSVRFHSLTPVVWDVSLTRTIPLLQFNSIKFVQFKEVIYDLMPLEIMGTITYGGNGEGVDEGWMPY